MVLPRFRNFSYSVIWFIYLCDLAETHIGTGPVPHAYDSESRHWKAFYIVYEAHIDMVGQEISNSIANALELRISCTNPSI